ncbi:hypothetical protein AMTRI_Chr12g270050 [Amborella trichopoda]
MDFIDGLPISKGKSTIFVVVDRLSKYVYFTGISHPYTALGVAQVFFDQIFLTSWHSSIGKTPFEVVYGWAPPTLLAYVPEMAKIIKDVREKIKEAQARMKRIYNSKHTKREFSVGDRLPTNSKIHPVFHVSVLKKIGAKVIVQSQLPSVREEDEKITPNPQAILERRLRKREQEVLIHWQGLSPMEARWENLEFIEKQFPDFCP